MDKNRFDEFKNLTKVCLLLRSIFEKPETEDIVGKEF